MPSPPFEIRARSRTFPAITACLLLGVALGGCADEETLPTELDAAANVVEASPVDFAPTEGGFGQGVYEDSDPFTFLVLSQGAIDSSGEGNCGQFSRDEDGLQLTLGGVLAPGTWAIAEDADGYVDGEASLVFAEGGWSGTVTVSEGSEEHGATVAGTIDASTASGERFAMSFEVLFHGCGVD